MLGALIALCRTQMHPDPIHGACMPHISMAVNICHSSTAQINYLT